MYVKIEKKKEIEYICITFETMMVKKRQELFFVFAAAPYLKPNKWIRQ